MKDIIEKLSKKWKREFALYVEPNIFAMYAEEALTGWALIIDEPNIQKFNGKPCVAVYLQAWVMIKTLAHETVTPFRVVAKGKGLIEKPFMPHTGLKYAIRNFSGNPRILIPVEDFKSV